MVDVMNYPAVRREIVKISIGCGIKRMREKRGLSQERLGDLVAVSGVTISNIENGRKDCTLALGVQIAQALGCCVEDLLEEEYGNQQKDCV